MDAAQEFRDLRDWILMHGVEAVEFFPVRLERVHLSHEGRITKQMDSEWSAIREYFREEADADSEKYFRVKRAGERFMFMLRMIRGEVNDPRAKAGSGTPQGSTRRTVPTLTGVSEAGIVRPA